MIYCSGLHLISSTSSVYLYSAVLYSCRCLIPHVFEKRRSLCMTVLQPDPVNYLRGSVCQKARGTIFRHAADKGVLRHGEGSDGNSDEKTKQQKQGKLLSINSERKGRRRGKTMASWREDRKRETMYRRAIQWRRATLSRDTMYRKKAHVQSGRLSFHTNVGIPAAFCQ